jgi:hypothetical protein
MDDDLIALNTLKKATPNISRYINLVRMDIDDFYTIVQLLNDSKCEGLEIVVEGFLIDDPKKIERLAQSRIFDFVIHTSTPYFSIELHRYRETRVYAGDDSMLSLGLVTTALQILDRYSFVRPLGYVLWVLGITTAGANLFILLRFFLLHQLLVSLPLTVATLVFTAGWLWFFIAYRNKFIFYIRHKHDTFTKRHKARLYPSGCIASRLAQCRAFLAQRRGDGVFGSGIS